MVNLVNSDLVHCEIPIAWDLGTLPAEENIQKPKDQGSSFPIASPIVGCPQSIGQLRILVAGDSGVGKTSFVHRLLHAIGQYSGVQVLDSSSANTCPRHSLTEYRASTTFVTPVFHANTGTNTTTFDPPSDHVPANNVTIIDTPGYGETAEPLKTMGQVLKRLRGMFVKTRRIYAPDISLSELRDLLSGGRGAHKLVDIVLYLVQRVKPVDVEYVRMLGSFAYVVPCVVVDGLKETQVKRAGSEARRVFEEGGIMWSEKNGMVILEATYGKRAKGDHGEQQDSVFPLVVRTRAQENKETNDDFGRLCDYLFRPPKLNKLRYQSVDRFIDWLDEIRKEEEEEKEEEEKGEEEGTKLASKEHKAKPSSNESVWNTFVVFVVCVIAVNISLIFFLFSFVYVVVQV